MRVKRSPATIVAEMRARVDDAGVAIACINDLCNITSSQAVLDACACEAIIAAVRNFNSNAAIAHSACTALSNIAALPAGQKATVDADAPAAIIKAMTTHANVAAVAHSGCEALYNIAARDYYPGQQAAIGAGALATVVAALMAHENDAIVAEYGCLALWTILALPTELQEAVDAGAPAAIVAAMAAHSGKINVVRSACWALGKITSVSAGAQSALEAGVLAAVYAAMHAYDAPLTEYALHLTRQLFQWACGSENVPAMQSFVAFGEIGPLVRANDDEAIRVSAENGLAVVVFLHEHGADICARSNFAVRQARRNGHQPVVDYLLAHGADLTVHELVLDGLPPDELAARLKSCKACWITQPERLVCSRGDGAQPPHNEPHECGICMRYPDCCEPSFPGGAHYEGNACEECRPFWEKKWVAFRCGHVCHLRCAMGWAASKTHAARIDDNLGDAPRVDCPHGRCVEIVRVHQGLVDEALPGGLVRVQTVERFAVA